MESNEKSMTPEESLQIIRKAISNSRRNLREGSFYYLLWGWVLLCASILCYFMLRYFLRREMYEDLYWKALASWLVPVMIGFIIQWIYKSRNKKQDVVRSYIDHYLTYLWVAAGIIFALMAVLSYFLGVYPTPFILPVMGLATFVSGIIVRFTPLMFGGIIFVLASIVTAFVPDMYQLIVFAVSIVFGYLA
ncbi:MAG: hypothetical protein AMS27_05045, partial [Bacteroides sp. SM23_62_1]